MTKINRPEVNLKDESPDNWKFKLDYDARGNIKPALANCVDILTNDTRFKGFALNKLARKVEVTGPLPWSRDAGARFWCKDDRPALCMALNRLYTPFRKRTIDTAFTAVAANRWFNPLEAWLKGLPAWDKVPRIDTLLSRCLGAEQSDYTAAVMRKTLLAAVARAYAPGIKFDYVPVLDGPHSIGKSTFWRLLAGDEYFKGSLTFDKNTAKKIQGYWFAELAELAGMSKANIGKKCSFTAFITRQDDDYRAAYARTVEQHPRMTILVGAVNGERGYLRGLTGERRFWPVVCKGAPEGVAAVWALARERDQIWAEALEMYKELCHDKRALARALQMNTPELRAAALGAQTGAIVVDDREATIEAYLDTPILRPEVWARLPIEQRARFIRGKAYAVPGEIDLSREPRVQRNRVCLPEIYLEYLGGTALRYDDREQAAMAQLMERLRPRWVRSGRRAGFGPYGAKAVEYVRVRDDDAAGEVDGVEIPF